MGLQAHIPGHALPDAKATRVPSFVKTLTLQNPAPSSFSVLDLAWSTVQERNKYFQVAAVPVDRLQDFFTGEGERGSSVPGCTLLNIETKSQTEAPGVLTRLVVRCKYGHLRKTAQKEKAARPINEHQGDRNALSLGLSIKKGCGYEFTVKRYAKHPGMAVIKFVSEEGVAPDGLCSAMRHLNPSGVNVHEGLTMHVPHTNEMREFVAARLKSNCSTRTVLKGAPSRCEFKHAKRPVGILIVQKGCVVHIECTPTPGPGDCGA